MSDMKSFMKKMFISLVTVFIIWTTTCLFYRTQTFYIEFAQGRYNIGQRQYLRAREFFLKALTLNPNDIKTIQYLFLVDRKLNSDKGSQAVYEAIKNKSVKNEAFKLMVADYFYSMAYYNQAERIYKRLTSKQERFDIQKKLAEVLVWQEKYDEALVLLEGLIKENDNDISLKLLSANTYFWAKRYDEAIEEYQDLVRFGLNKKEVFINLADALRFSGQDQEAIEVYEMYLKE